MSTTATTADAPPLTSAQAETMQRIGGRPEFRGWLGRPIPHTAPDRIVVRWQTPAATCAGVIRPDGAVGVEVILVRTRRN
jgi:hypothetical protein